MNSLLKTLEIASTALLTTITLLWRWVLNTALITIVVGLAVFLATQNIESYSLADYQELMRGYALLASIATAVMFILNSAISIFFRGSIKPAMGTNFSDSEYSPRHYSNDSKHAASRPV